MDCSLTLSLTGIVVVVGNYGSGKTEIAINMAAHHRLNGIEVRMADLDLVNPYFRTREARSALASLGIDLVLPPEAYLHADLPILTPAVAGLIRSPAPLTILDAGGDDVGATVLAALADALSGARPRMLQVVNPFRPFTDTVEGCLKIREEIERASKLTMSGIIGNANLIDDTAPEDIYEGHAFVQALSAESGLPVEFVTAPESLVNGLDLARFSCPVLIIRRQLVPPWRTKAKLGPSLMKIDIQEHP